MILKLALSELKKNKKFTLFFIFNLTIGLSGLLALNTFKDSLDQSIKSRSKSVLGADFGVSARRPLSKVESNTIIDSLPIGTLSSNFVETYSMAASLSGVSRLVQVKAIQPNYPFYGEIGLKNFGAIRNGVKKHLKKNNVWVYPEVLLQLNLRVGDTLKLGDSTFTISDVVTNDAAAGFSTTMAPRIYIDLNNLRGTKLLRAESLAWYSIVYKTNNLSINSLNKYRDDIFDSLADPAIQIYTHENASAQMGRLFGFLNDFLGLAALAALFLSAIGNGFLFRSFLAQRVKQMAILLTLGMSPAKTYLITLSQVTLLGAISSFTALALSLILAPIIKASVGILLPVDTHVSLSASTVLISFIIATLGSASTCLPLLVQIKGLKPSLLLNQKIGAPLKLNITSFLSFLPGLFLFWLTSVWLSNSYKVGTLFMALLIACSIILFFFSWVLFLFLNSSIQTNNLSLKWSVRNLARNKSASTSAFLALGLGVLLLNLIPQIKASIDTELQSPAQSRLPSLFLFDIQEEQLPLLSQILKNHGVAPESVSPMIRGRLMKVNEKAFKKKNSSRKNSLREAESEDRFRNRGFNLSYRAGVSDSEAVYKGRPFSGTYDDSKAKGILPEISLETRFAKRLGLKIGDILTFNIQSIEIKGVVVNLRNVKWTSFQPNFFILFQPGVLNLAPKTYLATLPSIEADKKSILQTQIVKKLSNVSQINIARLVSRIKKLIDQMSIALSFMSILSLLVGFIVLYSIINHQARNNEFEIGLLKALGADFKSIQNSYVFQYSILAFFSGLIGIGLSLFLSFILSQFLFKNLWAYDLITPIFSLLITLILCVFVTRIATYKSLQVSPRSLLKN